MTEKDNGAALLHRISFTADMLADVAAELRDIHNELVEYAGEVVDGSLMSTISRVANSTLDNSLKILGVMTVVSTQAESYVDDDVDAETVGAK